MEHKFNCISMPISHKPLTPKQLVELAQQLDHKGKLLFVQEFVSTLDTVLLEAIKFEVEQALVLSKLDESELEDLDESPVKNIEFKRIKSKYYAYLRWREDGRHKSEYLGPMPFLLNRTYILTSKKDSQIKVLTPLSLEVEGNQIYLKVQILKPTNTIKSYSYPECLNTVFSKKEWLIKQITSPSTASEEAPSSNFSEPKYASTQLVQIEVRDADEPENSPNYLELDRIKTKSTRNTQTFDSELTHSHNSETLRNKSITILKVPNDLFPQLYVTLKQWENLSQSPYSTLRWNLVDKDNKIFLHSAQENKIIIEYNKALGSVTCLHPIPVLIEWLKQIANNLSSSKSVDQDTKTQAIKIKTRIQGASGQDNAVLLAYLLGLPKNKISKQ